MHMHWHWFTESWHTVAGVVRMPYTLTPIVSPEHQEKKNSYPRSFTFGALGALIDEAVAKFRG